MTAPGNSIQEFTCTLHGQLEDLFSDRYSNINSREDSRAFGAMIEQKVATGWQSICAKMKSEHIPRPGRRTIYDFATRYKGKLFGVDVKTKDLDSEIYSDGGVCSVSNLLKFLVNDHAVFIVVELGHNQASTKSHLRNLKYVRVAPFHLLPEKAYRVENLGTGQVRLNYAISEIYNEIEWNRSLEQFLDIFVDITIRHYRKVSQKSQERIERMRKFQKDGYKTF